VSGRYQAHTICKLGAMKFLRPLASCALMNAGIPSISAPAGKVWHVAACCGSAIAGRDAETPDTKATTATATMQMQVETRDILISKETEGYQTPASAWPDAVSARNGAVASVLWYHSTGNAMASVNLRLPDDLHERLRSTASLRGISLQDLLVASARAATHIADATEASDGDRAAPANLDVVLPDRLMGEVRGPSWVIAHARRKLAAKLYACKREVCWKSLDFERYRVRASKDLGWADRIEGGDLMATHLMNSRLKDQEAYALIQAAPTIERLLPEVPNSHLHETDLRRIRPQLRELFKAVRVGGVGPAKATKLLSLKRHRLIPMIDSQVLIALYGRAWQMATFADDFADELLDAVARFQAVLQWKEGEADNLAALKHATWQTEGDLRLVTGEQIDISPTRALDTLLWFDWWGYEYYGFRWNRVARTVDPDPSVRPRPTPDDPEGE
jgi:hypothetical protein